MHHRYLLKSTSQQGCYSHCRHHKPELWEGGDLPKITSGVTVPGFKPRSESFMLCPGHLMGRRARSPRRTEAKKKRGTVS